MAMHRRRVRVGSLERFHLAQLSELAYGALLLLIGFFALGKTIIVEAAASLKRGFKQTRLALGRIEAILEGFQHLNTLLRLYITTDRFFADIARCTGKVGACPHRRQFSQRSILFSQPAARCAFALFDHIRRAVGCPDTHKEMDVIGLDGKLKNFPSLFLALFFKELATVGGNTVDQNRLAPLGTPDEVIDNQVNSVFISLIFHMLNYTGLSTNSQLMQNAPVLEAFAHSLVDWFIRNDYVRLYYTPVFISPSPV